METPSFTRRVTRSQTLASVADSSNNKKNSVEISKSEKSVTKSRQRKGRDRCAFVDITNDSPIVGLAMGSLKTPSSTMSKKRIKCQAHKASTPGSGEALLRGQVKTLLQKVEEEADISKITLLYKPFFNLVNSPMGLLAPTPANTPQISNLSDSKNYLPSVTPSPVEDKILISQNQVISEIAGGKKQEDADESECVVTRSLLFDFSEKSDVSDSFVLTYQDVRGECSEVKPSTDDDDDDASIWSIQVNTSSVRDDCEEDDDDCFEEVDQARERDYDDDEEEYDQGLLDELCEGMIKMNVNVIKFTGKHTRFMYNSDGEFEGELRDGETESPAL